jgi:hypothetical protein
MHDNFFALNDFSVPGFQLYLRCVFKSAEQALPEFPRLETGFRDAVQPEKFPHLVMDEGAGGFIAQFLERGFFEIKAVMGIERLDTDASAMHDVGIHNKFAHLDLEEQQ